MPLPDRTTSPLRFLPELELDRSCAPAVSVKGDRPRLTYPFTFLDLYGSVPERDLKTAYAEISAWIAQVDRVLAPWKGPAPSTGLRPAETAAEAARNLALLLDPSHSPVRSEHPEYPTRPLLGAFQLEVARPFPLALASRRKLLHTLVWIDTNVKLQLEALGDAKGMPVDVVRQVAEAALWIYALLVKSNDYTLARAINFNHSMFLQDRILCILMGEGLYSSGPVEESRGRVANDMALALLIGLGDLTLPRLCELSVYMGVVWTSDVDNQLVYQRSAEKALSGLEGTLQRARTPLSIDHSADFMAWVGQDREEILLVVLDDNGESAFDLALVQRLLQETGHVTFAFLLNRARVSTNLSVSTWEGLLAQPYFAALREGMRSGRVRVCEENLYLRSFEPAYLSSAGTLLLQQASVAFVKGVNFFETFQPAHLVRYYGFTVHGWTSAMLTGLPEGSGVFARVRAGETGYVYTGPDQIRTLKAVVEEVNDGQ